MEFAKFVYDGYVVEVELVEDMFDWICKVSEVKREHGEPLEVIYP